MLVAVLSTGIICLLLLIYLIIFGQTTSFQPEQRAIADIQSLEVQLQCYRFQNHYFPTTEQGLNALVKLPTTEPIPLNWHQLLEKFPLDPWGRPYRYCSPGKHNPDEFDVFSLGADGRESNDDIGNWTKP